MDHKNLLKKAELLTCSAIVLDRSVQLPFPLSRGSAGPGAGSNTIVLEFGGTRANLMAIRETVGNNETPFKLLPSDPLSNSLAPDSNTETEQSIDPQFRILKDDKPFLHDVRVVRTLIHAPDQAFINIDARCQYRCLFCSSPHLKNYKRISNDRWISIIRDAANSGRIRSIALTSGIPGTIEENVRDFEDIIQGVSDLGLPIGVEPYIQEPEHVQRLYDSGASELKLNVETWDRKIFREICPDLDLDRIIQTLEHGIEIYGKNRVTSNIIIGFGESDENVVDGIESLARMGVAANIRILHLNQYNREPLEKIRRVEPIIIERLLFLRNEQIRIFRAYDIHPEEFRTMCFPCKGCDLEPY